MAVERIYETECNHGPISSPQYQPFIFLKLGMNLNCHHTGNLHFPLFMTDYKRDVLTFWYCPLGCRPFSMIFNHASSLGRSFFRKESAVRSSSCNLAILLSKQDEA